MAGLSSTRGSLEAHWPTGLDNWKSPGSFRDSVLNNNVEKWEMEYDTQYLSTITLHVGVYTHLCIQAYAIHLKYKLVFSQTRN